MNDIQPREIHDGPFLWQSKLAMDVIEEAFDSIPGLSVSAAKSVYVGLSRLSSDDYSKGRFRCTVAQIAAVSSVSPRVVHRILPKFEELRLIHIFRIHSKKSNMREPSEFTLLPDSEICWRSEPDLDEEIIPFCHGDRSMCHDGRTICQN
jgi:hypothetical protein